MFIKIPGRLSALLLGATIAGISASPAQATILFEDNFNGESLGLGKTLLTNWNVTAGNVDVKGPGFFNIYPGNGNYLDMDGTPAANATIETKQAFGLTPGTYQLSFKIGNNTYAGNKLFVQLGSLFSETINSQPTLTSITRSIVVKKATSATLLFSEQGPADRGGSILDNVMLEQTQAASVPEPSALLGTIAVAGAIAANKRRFKHQSEES